MAQTLCSVLFGLHYQTSVILQGLDMASEGLPEVADVTRKPHATDPKADALENWQATHSYWNSKVGPESDTISSKDTLTGCGMGALSPPA